MKVSIKRGKDTTKFGHLQVGVVFECDGIKFMKIFGYEFGKNQTSVGKVYRALDLKTMEESKIDDDTEISVDSLFVPKEIVLK